MGKLNVILDDDLEEQFRGLVADTLGMKKGNLGIAFKEAIELWIKTTAKHHSSKK